MTASVVRFQNCGHSDMRGKGNFIFIDNYQQICGFIQGLWI